MNKFLLLFLLLSYITLFAGKSFSEDSHKAIVDIYGTQKITAAMVKKRYGRELQQITDTIQSPDSITSAENTKILTGLLEKVYNGINKMGTFAYANISPVFYPESKDVYFTIDVVDKADSKRLAYFLPKPDKTFIDPDNLLKKWQEYEKIGSDKAMKEKAAIAVNECPAFHCIYGFDDPALKKYKNIFVKKVPKNQTQLVEILRSDKDETKRATAAFLLAHIKDGNELIKILVPAMRDPSSGVRNNVMRVLGETLFKLKTADFPIAEAVTALDFPTTTDRNKALMILTALATQSRYAIYLKENAQTQLLTELKMQQLNVHDLANEILKTISGKDFGQRNYAAWEKWLKA